MRNITGISLLIGLLCASRAPAQVPVGEYVAVDPGGAAISAAINRAGQDFNFFIRPIAKKRLRAANPIPRTLSIKQFGDSVQVVLNGELSVRTKPGSTREWRGFNNEPIKVTTTLEGGVLTNTFVAEDGTKQNRYVLRSDGMLELSVRVTSSKLKHPLEYTQLFRRT